MVDAFKSHGKKYVQLVLHDKKILDSRIFATVLVHTALVFCNTII